MIRLRIKNQHLTWITTFIVCMLWVSIVSAQSYRVYTIMGWEPWEPYQYKNQKNQLTGLDIDLVTAIMNVSKIPIQFEEMPWKRHLNEVKMGNVDLAAGAFKTKERQAYAFFSDSYRTESVVMYIRKEDSSKWNFTSLKDIIGTKFQLGVTRGYYYGEDYAKIIKNPDFQRNVGEVTAESQCLQMLKLKNIDGFLSDPVSASATLGNEGMLDDVKILFTVYSNDIYMMISKKSKSPEFVKTFNKNLSQLRETGVYRKILGEYLKLEPEKKAEPEPSPEVAPLAEVLESIKSEDSIATEDLEVMKRQKKAYQSLKLRRYLKKGQSGEDIKKLQIILNSLGYYKGAINSNFSTELDKAVRKYQIENNLSPDGIVGPLTYNMMGTH